MTIMHKMASLITISGTNLIRNKYLVSIKAQRSHNNLFKHSCMEEEAAELVHILKTSHRRLNLLQPFHLQIQQFLHSSKHILL